MFDTGDVIPARKLLTDARELQIDEPKMLTGGFLFSCEIFTIVCGY